jgi:hypothetical protein
MTDEPQCCMHCTEPLNALDMDPNGDMPCVCVRCRAEEAHDFDKEPRARFDRAGRRVYATAKQGA